MKLTKMIKRFVKDERGLEASEYALLLALICVAIAATVTALKNAIVNTFNRAENVIRTANTTP